MPYSDINAMRKQGNLQQALVMAEAEYAHTPGRMEAIALFWCLNEDLKNTEGEEAQAIVTRMHDLWQKHAPENEVLGKTVGFAQQSLTPEAQAERRGWKLYKAVKSTENIDEKKKLMFQYLKLDNPRPSLLHSLFLREALKIEKQLPEEMDLSIFTDLWDLNNLREDDWVQYKGEEGHTPYSLVEKLIGALVKELIQKKQQPTPIVNALINQAIEQFPKNCYLPRYQAQLLTLMGQKEEAIKKFKELLLKNPEKFYLWDDLADLIDNPDIKIGLLCGAITSGALDNYLPKVRLKLAEQLCNKQLYANALTELELHCAIQQRNNWPLRSTYYGILNRVPKSTLPADNRALYNEYKNKALEFVYSEVPTVILVKSWEKKDMFNGKPNLSWQLRCDQEVYWLKPKRFRLDFRSPNGTIFRAKVDQGQVVWIEPATLDEDLPWLRQATGTLQIKQPGNGKLFAFVDGVYLPGTMIGNRQDGATVTVTALRSPDDRWNAIAIA